jgi:hypothetical protein
MGALQGLSPCPPFLMAVGLALTAPDEGVLGGTLLFVSLFFGTALFTLPLAFLEPLRRRVWLFGLLRIVGGLVCVYLVLQGLALLRG